METNEQKNDPVNDIEQLNENEQVNNHDDVNENGQINQCELFMINKTEQANEYDGSK